MPEQPTYRIVYAHSDQKEPISDFVSEKEALKAFDKLLLSWDPKPSDEYIELEKYYQDEYETEIIRWHEFQ